MDRRAFLGIALATGIVGCVGRSGGGTRTSAPRTFTPQSDRTTETRMEQSVIPGFPVPSLSVLYSGPMNGDPVRVIITITDAADDPVFERVGTLEPGESVAFNDILEDSGTYRVEIRLDSGTKVTKEIEVSNGGMPNYAGYAARILSSDIEIGIVEV